MRAVVDAMSGRRPCRAATIETLAPPEPSR
jgi:hypothetical protein